jgi:hypothetical protein
MLNPDLQAVRIRAGTMPADEAWGNDIYQVVVSHFESGLTHLSIKRNDRHVIRDWRHLQSMKNEICGPEREAVEIYPAESRLVDSANEYHLWVLPEEMTMGFGFDELLVSSDFQAEEFNRGRELGHHKGRQRPFQPGLKMAESRNEGPKADLPMMSDAYLSQPMTVKQPMRGTP